jgi:hypothetical protein
VRLALADLLAASECLQRLVEKRRIGTRVHRHAERVEKLCNQKRNECRRGAENDAACHPAGRAQQQRHAPPDPVGKIARRHLEDDDAQEVEPLQQKHFVDGEQRREVEKEHRHPEKQILEELKKRVETEVSFHR